MRDGQEEGRDNGCVGFTVLYPQRPSQEEAEREGERECTRRSVCVRKRMFLSNCKSIKFACTVIHMSTLGLAQCDANVQSFVYSKCTDLAILNYNFPFCHKRIKENRLPATVSCTVFQRQVYNTETSL